MKTSLKKNRVIAIVGATASGKTAYSIELAKKLDGEIISADSRYVYKGLDIGTAKPNIKERDGVPHYMIDIVEPSVDYSAGLYVEQAKKYIEEISAKGKIPIVVGGTGLYFNILFDNYKLPKIEADWDLREKLSSLDWDTLYNMLLGLDKDCANINIEKNDKKKIIRVIEILKLTGKTLKEVRSKGECEYDVEWIGLNFPREELYDRINRRVDFMVDNGLLQETKSLISKYGCVHNIVDTIGYKEMLSYLNNELSFEDAILKLKQNSRRYAKRQLTWFRRNDKINWNYYPDKKLK
ncbi:MAG: tRNA (adenosine(37)-N6)-dimethylallyltransferase MiaA [Clostridiaceae bacterium]|jgi:tRNA dimethylallyltransferase|nr:tRNA (adenosine(37)-N6)-dimethylallyltransferase MiaA [Clostridiaceae bacterium]